MVVCQYSDDLSMINTTNILPKLPLFRTGLGFTFTFGLRMRLEELPSDLDELLNDLTIGSINNERMFM